MLITGNSPQIATIIANLLNENNNLPKKYDAGHILNSRATYYPILIGQQVLASVAMDRLSFFMTEVKHLVVPPALRGAGLAKRLLSICLPAATTPYLVATVRTDNAPSLHLFHQAGFMELAEVINDGHPLKFLGRQNLFQ
mgnify:CR=1 FL=1